MRVAITGGTGFVGSHTAAAVAEAGHEVRLLVRNPDRVVPALEPLGVDASRVDVALADVNDPDAVAAGLAGVDAVIHAASVYTLDPRRRDEIATTNDAGVRTVLQTALDTGLDPIVHVSSMVVFHRDDAVGATITPDSPVGNSPYPYGMSKIRQEMFARRLQDGGAPVVITYPGGVLGPDDPHDGESVRFFRSAVKGKLSLVPDISVAWVDVRDVAAVHAAALEPGQGPRRFVAGGHTIPTRSMVEMITTAYGEPRHPKRVGLGPAKMFGVIGDVLGRFGMNVGVSSEALWYGSRNLVADNSQTEAQLGVRLRPIQNSIDDQIRWMKETGKI